MKKNIVIIILAILVLGLGGYLVYDKVLSSGNKEEIGDNEQQEVDYDIIAAQYIIDSFLTSKTINVIDRIVDTKLDEETKLAMAIANTEPDFNSYSCADLFDVNTSYGEYRPVDQWTCIQSDIPNSYKYEDVNKQYKKFFGSSKEAQKQGVASYNGYGYSKKKDVYATLSPLFGPIRTKLYYYEAENAKIKGNELKIETSYLTYHYAAMGVTDSFSYYIGEALYENKTKDEVIKAYNDNKKSLPTLTFVLEKENNNYVLKSVE